MTCTASPPQECPEKPPEDVTDEERSAAKRVNFGAIYGMGANGLVKSAGTPTAPCCRRGRGERAGWRPSPKPTPSSPAGGGNTPTDALERRSSSSARTPPRASVGFTRCRACLRTNPPTRFPAIFPSKAPAPTRRCWRWLHIDELLFEHGIDGGPVAWLHDEIVLEVPTEHAVKAAELLVKAMLDAFAETFPGAPLNGLVEANSGLNWAAAKEKKAA